MPTSLDKNTKILFVLMLVLICGSIIFSVYKYLLQRDYLLYAKVGCNPAGENCFIQECDSGEDARCPYTGKYYYKILFKNASEFTPCLSDAGNTCTELNCGENEYCEILYCSEENLASFELEDSCVSDGRDNQ